MCLDDRLADGKTDAHVFLHIKAAALLAGKRAVEERRKSFARNAEPVVADREAGLVADVLHAQPQLRRALAVQHCIFHQVEQHLLDERRVHRDEHDLLRHLDCDADVAFEALFEFVDRGREDLLRRLIFLADGRLLA